ncbi:MAG: hypothetical protein V4719_20445 [Planctomycetota bacterium]
MGGVSGLIISVVLPWVIGHFGSGMILGTLLKLGVPQAIAQKIVSEVIDLLKLFLQRPLNETEQALVKQKMERVFRDPFDSRN